MFIATCVMYSCGDDILNDIEYGSTNIIEEDTLSPSEVDTTYIPNENELPDSVDIEHVEVDTAYVLNTDTAPTSNEDSIQLDLEIPRLTKDMPEQILKRIGYTVSYNITTKNPNWVAWVLTKDHTTGPINRIDGYDNDYTIYGYQPKEKDWDDMPDTLSHGHMCPAADNKWNRQAMEQSTLLSNICPQAKNLNSGSWNKLEGKCRDWAEKYDSIYIVCGPVFYSDSIKTMGAAKIWVPDAFYKVVLCMTGKPKAIGFIYTNDNLSHNMQKSVRSVAEIEALTGIDFFCSLPDEIEYSIEASAYFNAW